MTEMTDVSCSQCGRVFGLRTRDYDAELRYCLEAHARRREWYCSLACEKAAGEVLRQSPNHTRPKTWVQPCPQEAVRSSVVPQDASSGVGGTEGRGRGSARVLGHVRGLRAQMPSSEALLAQIFEGVRR